MYLRTRLINKHCVGHTSRLKIIADLISNVYSEGRQFVLDNTFIKFIPHPSIIWSPEDPDQGPEIKGCRHQGAAGYKLT